MYSGLVDCTLHVIAVHRTLIDALRTIVIWVVELIIYYAGAEVFTFNEVCTLNICVVSEVWGGFYMVELCAM